MRNLIWAATIAALVPGIALAQVTTVRIGSVSGGTVATVDANGVEVQGAGTAGTAAGGVVSVQGVAGMTNVNVDSKAAVNTTNATASGALGALNAAVSISGQGAGDIHWEIDTGTLVGTVVFEATLDDTNWFAINAMRINGTIISSTTTFADRGVFDTGGYSQVRLRVSAYTSGTSNGRAEASASSGAVRLTQAIPAGTNNIGDVDIVTLPNEGQQTMVNSISVALASDQSALAVDTTSADQMTVLFSQTGTNNDVDITTFPDNEPINVAQMNGVAVTMGNGISGTGVQRVTLASDSTGQVTLAAGSATIGALTANQSVNVAQIAGVATSTGNGIAGTGVQRVAIASDNTAFSVNVGTFPDNEPFNVAQWGGTAVVAPVADNADDVAVATSGLPRTAARLYAFDGTSWDRLRINASGELNVAAAIPAPTSPNRTYCSNAISVGASADCDGAQVASTKTAKLQNVTVSGAGNMSCILRTVLNATATDRIGFNTNTSSPSFTFTPAHRDYIVQAESATAGLDALRVSCTNDEPTGGTSITARVSMLWDEL